MTDSRIAQIEQTIALLESLPDFLWTELENDPEIVDTYYSLISRLYSASMGVMFDFAEIKTAKITKYGTSEEQQKVLQKMSDKISEADFQRFIEQSRTTSVSEIRRLIDEKKEVKKIRRRS